MFECACLSICLFVSLSLFDFIVSVGHVQRNNLLNFGKRSKSYCG